MTGWLGFFISDMEISMVEEKERGDLVIRLDMPVLKHGLNERQGKAVEFLLGHGKLTIQDFEALCPEVSRRSLQLDIKGMMDKKLISSEGATHHHEYRLL